MVYQAKDAQEAKAAEETPKPASAAPAKKKNEKKAKESVQAETFTGGSATRP